MSARQGDEGAMSEGTCFCDLCNDQAQDLITERDRLRAELEAAKAEICQLHLSQNMERSMAGTPLQQAEDALAQARAEIATLAADKPALIKAVDLLSLVVGCDCLLDQYPMLLTDIEDFLAGHKERSDHGC